MEIKRGLLAVVFLGISLFLINFVSADFFDNGELVQNVTDCGVLNTTNAIYSLNQSLNSSFNCLNINASNITLDCQGYNITFGNATGGKGIFVDDGEEGGYDNITIQNCIVVQNESGADHTAIFFGEGSENGVVYNNTIIVYGLDTPGMLFESNSVNANISFNNITTSSELGFGIVLGENGTGADIRRNIIITSGNDSSGIKMGDYSSNGLIYNNNITTSGDWSAADNTTLGGIFLDILTDNINVSTNTIIMSGYDTAGIWVWSCYNHSIEKNIITSSGESGKGIFLSDLEGVNVISNTINVTGDSGDGIWSYISENPLLFYNNVITTNGNYIYGFNLDQDSNSNFSSNNITTSGSYSYGIFSNQAHNNTIENNIVKTEYSTSYLLYFDTSSNYMIYNNLFNTSTTGSGVYINNSDLNYFNTTEGTATNIIGEAYIGGNFWTNNAGTGFSDNCLDSDSDYFCDSAYVVVDNDPHTDYLPLTNRNNMVSACRTLDFVGRTYYLNQSIVEINGTCFNIIANNITFDFRGYNLTGNTTGYGINMSHNYTTLRDGFIYNFSIGIYLKSSQNNNITNITINENELNGIYVSASLSNLFINININNSRQDAIILEGADSDNNNFTDVSVINTNLSYYDINFSTAGIDGTWIIGINFGNYSFAGAGGKVNFEEPSFGKINFLEAINGSGNSLSTEIDIESNSAFVNSSINPGLNKSANITFYSISYTDPKPQYSSDGTTFIDCTPTTDPACSELSFSGNTFVFNVSHFTYFKTAEGYSAPLTPSVGGGGGGTTTFWTNTFVVNDSQFTEGFTREYSIKQRAKIKIGTEDHYMGVVSLTSTTATINVSSMPQQAILGIGETKKFDANNDSYYDVLVKINSINNSKANITLLGLHERIQTSNSEANNDEYSNDNTPSSATSDDKEMVDVNNKSLNNEWLIPIIVVIILVMIVALIFILKTKK